MFGTLINPNYPKAAIGFGNGTVSAVALTKRRRGQYGVRNAATANVSKDVLIPSFEESNILDPYGLVSVLDALVVDAGLGAQKKWSVALPSASARTAIITLDEAPVSKSELDEVFTWKSETAFGVSTGDLRVSRIEISRSSESKRRFFASAVKLSVLDEYENVFGELGWKAGLVMPRAIGESNWFRSVPGDSLLISTQEHGFTALLMRNNEPVVVRSVTCKESEMDDEVYRLLVYYQDRVATKENGRLSKLLVLGEGMDRQRVREITSEATGEALHIATPEELGFELPVESISFEDLAAPAGLAALGWG